MGEKKRPLDVQRLDPNYTVKTDTPIVVRTNLLSRLMTTKLKKEFSVFYDYYRRR